MFYLIGSACPQDKISLVWIFHSIFDHNKLRHEFWILLWSLLVIFCFWILWTHQYIFRLIINIYKKYPGWIWKSLLLINNNSTPRLDAINLIHVSLSPSSVECVMESHLNPPVLVSYVLHGCRWWMRSLCPWPLTGDSAGGVTECALAARYRRRPCGP